jgi:hypothetical protein
MGMQITCDIILYDLEPKFALDGVAVISSETRNLILSTKEKISPGKACRNDK